MLLPSDVARLVLGYLQQEKLTATCRSFIAESPNLKEYAEHYTDDGNIPGCLLSLFGKNLTTVLNEYITMKAKENQAEVPFMMSSLWKKLDLTLSQIRCMQESAAFNTHQRTRTRKGINDRIRQKMLTSPLAASCSSVPHPIAQQTSTPIMATQYILHPLNTSGPLQSVATPLFGTHSTIQSCNSTHISIGEPTQSNSVTLTQRKQPSAATSSPMRRKPEVQRRRRIAPLSASVAAQEDIGGDGDAVTLIIDNDFPQMVIETAREKILSNKSLQEKLAENINRFLVSDSASQSSKHGDGAGGEHDPSIDEILGLQGGEIHMSEEAVHDILEQTVLDPDFQEFFDLLDYDTSKVPKNPSRDTSAQNSDAKNNVPGKGKKQDAVEGSLEMEVEPSNKKADVCPGGKEVAVSESPSQHTENATEEKTDHISTSQQTFDNDAPSPVDQSPKCNEQDGDVVTVDCTDTDILMDISKESQIASTSQSLDKMMNNSDEVEDSCQFVKEILPQASVVGEQSILCNKDSKSKVDEEPQDMQTIQVITNERLSEDTQQGITKNVTDTPPTTTVPPKVLLISVVDPVLNCTSPRNEKDKQLDETSKDSPVTKPVGDAANKQSNAADIGTSSEKELTTQNTAANAEHIEVHGQCSLASDIAALSSVMAVPGSSQTFEESPNIVTLKIIMEEVPEDAELDDAVRSINGDNYPTIILSPLVKSHDHNKVALTQETAVIDLTDTNLLGDQSQLVTAVSDGSVGTINIPSGDCTVYSISAAANGTGDGSVIQLMPATSTTFAPASNIFVSTCVANNGPSKQSNIRLLPKSSVASGNKKQTALFQTPPRPGSMYTVGQAISPKLSQGSTIILASPVQPVLQGVMGMFPVSLVGQSGSTFTAPSHQILHVPVSKPVIPKLPLPPKPPKPAPPKPIITGKPLSKPAADSSSHPSSSVVQRVGNEEKKSVSETQNKPDDRLLADSTSVAAKPMEAHRRVLCFDGASSTTATLNATSLSNSKSQKSGKGETAPNVPFSSGATRSNVVKENRKTESSAPTKGKNPKAPILKVTGPETAPAKDPTGEKRPVALSAGALGNKENVLQADQEKQAQAEVDTNVNGQESEVGRGENSVKTQPETNKKQSILPNILRRMPQKTSTERTCPASPLVKQASQLLQGTPFQSPNSKTLPVEDLPIPRTPGSGMDDKPLDNHVDHKRTPTCKRYDDGGTPKLMKPPATPELPTCSPASEAGSESSVNMAAHTLMILSRASLAKSGGTTPLKDNIQQSKSSKSASRKRKLEEADDFQRPSHSKETLSPSSLQKKKMKKHRKKSIDSFPAGMDVEKFLMSLRYDE
ncbi:protein NPAT [Pseudophryne corroboree]|uniref:protein NPAT n=1 Tax=Pseudophryne corroboree TaxID=495146 RepID=UPI00308130EE